MISKGNKTRQFIITTSEQLFSQKGYSAVTMKDICEVCKLSRGGLYRHFSSTKEIFLEILNDDKNKMQYELEQCFLKKVSAKFLIDCFLEKQKAIIAGDNNGFYFAIHEFAFTQPDQREYMNNRFVSAIKLLVMLLDYGQAEGTFKKFESNVVATHITFFLDSIITSSTVLSVSEELINSQLKLIKDMVM